jgi:hypothetical protein
MVFIFQQVNIMGKFVVAHPDVFVIIVYNLFNQVLSNLNEF